MEGIVIDACVVDGTELDEGEPDVDENGWHIHYVCRDPRRHYYRGAHLGGGAWAPIDEGEYDEEVKQP